MKTPVCCLANYCRVWSWYLLWATMEVKSGIKRSKNSKQKAKKVRVFFFTCSRIANGFVLTITEYIYVSGCLFHLHFVIFYVFVHFFCVIMSNYLFFTVSCKRYKPSSVPFVKFNTNFSNQEQQWNKIYIHNDKEIKGLDRVNLYFLT